jgi:hypothetical protein
MVAMCNSPKATPEYMGIFSDFAGKTFKLGIAINAIWGIFRNELQIKEKPDHTSDPVFCLTAISYR